MRNDNIVKAEEVDGSYELTYVSASSILRSILDDVKWNKQSGKSTDGKVLISQALLAQVKNTVGNGFDESPDVDNLRKSGCTDEQAQIIYDGLRGKSNFISVFVIDFTNEEESLTSIMTVNSKGGSFELIAVEVDENEAVEFRAVDYDGFVGKLTQALAAIGIQDVGGDFA